MGIQTRRRSNSLFSRGSMLVADPPLSERLSQVSASGDNAGADDSKRTLAAETTPERRVIAMGKTLTEQITATAKGIRIWQQERAIFEITERICELMDEQEISRSQLAERLGTTRARVTQILDGTANMTLRTISDLYLALGRQFNPSDGPVCVEANRPAQGHGASRTSTVTRSAIRRPTDENGHPAPPLRRDKRNGHTSKTKRRVSGR